MLDSALTDAIAAVAEEEGQPPAVAARLSAWLLRMSRGDLSKDEKNTALQTVLEALVIKKAGHED